MMKVGTITFRSQEIFVFKNLNMGTAICFSSNTSNADMNWVGVGVRGSPIIMQDSSIHSFIQEGS